MEGVENITLVYCRCDAKLYLRCLIYYVNFTSTNIFVTCNDNVQLIDTNGT